MEKYITHHQVLFLLLWIILIQILRLIGNQNQDVIIIGESNINLAFPLTNSSMDLLSIMSGSYLFLSTTIPTRVTESTHSLIDNIFSTLCPAKVSVITSDTSDHFPMHTVFNTARMPTPLVRTNQGLQVIHLKEENLKLLNDELKKVSWDSVLANEDVNERFEIFHNAFVAAYKTYCFKEKPRNRGRKNTPICPWVTESLLICINKKNNLWANYRNPPIRKNLERYETYKKYLHSVLRKAKGIYVNNKISESGKDGRKVWKVINSILRPNDKRVELPSRLFVNGEAVMEPTQVAKELSTFFARIGGITSNSEKSPHKPFKHYKRLSMHQINGNNSFDINRSRTNCEDLERHISIWI